MVSLNAKECAMQHEGCTQEEKQGGSLNHPRGAQGYFCKELKNIKGRGMKCLFMDICGGKRPCMAVVVVFWINDWRANEHTGVN